MKSLKIRLTFLLLIFSQLSHANVSEVLTVSEFAQLKKKPCAIFYVWATWCQYCIKEMPEFLAKLEKMPNVEPIILDVSYAVQQKHFSVGYIAQLTTRKTYVAPPEAIPNVFVKSLDSEFGDILPYKVLYRGGQKDSEWTGDVDLNAVLVTLDKKCK